jgi:glutamate-1-semialdehyde 2,1-aminomutase
MLLAETATRAATLAEGLRSTLRDLGLDYAVLNDESIVDFKFRAGPATRSYDDQQRDDQQAYAAFYHAARARGILLPPSHNEVMFVSTAHTDADITATIAALDASLRELRAEGIV